MCAVLLSKIIYGLVKDVCLENLFGDERGLKL